MIIARTKHLIVEYNNVLYCTTRKHKYQWAMPHLDLWHVHREGKRFSPSVSTPSSCYRGTQARWSNYIVNPLQSAQSPRKKSDPLLPNQTFVGVWLSSGVGASRWERPTAAEVVVVVMKRRKWWRGEGQNMRKKRKRDRKRAVKRRKKRSKTRCKRRVKKRKSKKRRRRKRSRRSGRAGSWGWWPQCTQHLKREARM